MANNLAPSTVEISAALLERLHQLSYAEFARCMEQLLTAMGYADCQSLGRTCKKGWHDDSGADLVATMVTGATRLPVLVLLKQFYRPVQRRFIDELRGSMVVRGMSHGLVITTSTFPSGAKLAARPIGGTAITLIDGVNLTQHLITHRIGVIEDWQPRYRLDDTYFSILSHLTQSQTY